MKIISVLLPSDYTFNYVTMAIREGHPDREKVLREIAVAVRDSLGAQAMDRPAPSLMG